MTSIPTELRPKLRLLMPEVRQHEGKSYLFLCDPLQVAEGTLLLPQELKPLLPLLDGSRTLHQLAADLYTAHGVRIEINTIQFLVDALDEFYLLDNSRFHAVAGHGPNSASNGRTPGNISGHLATSNRPMTIAGAGYPARAKELAEFLNGYLPESSSETASLHMNVLGLLSPHIDYGRGGSVYGQVWSRVAQAAQEAEAVVIFATDHYGYDLFTLTRADYVTPYGVLPTDESLRNSLANALTPSRAYAGEARHRREHSVELVAVWLHHMRGGHPCPIVPILCGMPYDYLQAGKSPAQHPQIATVLETLQSQIQERRILIVASGDLAHVGPAFRGAPLDAASRAALRTADEELLEYMKAANAEGFYQAISAIQDRNNVCGLMPIYLTMELLRRVHGNLRGTVTGYASCPADGYDTSAVTIAGVVFS